MTINILAELEPVPFPRPASNGRRRFNPPRYSAFKDALGLIANRAMNGRAPLTGNIKLTVVFAKLRPANITSRNWGDLDNHVKAILDALKALAKELDVPVLALSQLNRGVEMRADKRPQLADLRESGSIEQDADIVMFLYRDEYYNQDDADAKNLAELIIAKNRNGKTGKVTLYFENQFMKFRDYTRVVR